MTRERIEDIREILLPFVKKQLLKINYENLGKSDAEEFEKDFNEILDLATKAIEQEPRRGHWFIDERPESDRETICSNCEQPIFKFHKLDFDYRPHFCPNCGAKMEESEE